jgi:pimeloyl-ACP methyl ester carboxylesterase
MMKKRLPIFQSSHGRQQYLAAYEAMFKLWTVPYDSVDVKTSFGSTHINITGPGHGSPLFLLQGAGLSSMSWYANVSGLSASHRVYAVDTIGDAGKSIAKRLIEKRSDYAQWLREVFDGLNMEKAFLMGHSHGGWLTLNMALHYPDRLRAIVLLAPAASIYPLGLIPKLIMYLGAMKIRPPARSMFKKMAPKGIVYEEAFIQLMEVVTKQCVPAMLFPDVYTDDELKQIEPPVLLLIGALEKIYNLKKAIERAERLIPKLTSEIIPNAGHTLMMDQPDIINRRVLDFLGLHE